MERINNEITNEFIANLLNDYIDYQGSRHLSQIEQEAILNFIIYLLKEN